MVLAYHIIMTAYGFWLPNDPRGSWSDFVWSWELLRFGPATKTTDRRSLARVPHDRELRLAAKEALLHPPVRFTGVQARAIARGFSDAKEVGNYRIFACSITHDHVHMVVGRHQQRNIERMANHLKGRATYFLTLEGLHPFQDEVDEQGDRPTPWTESFWQVYLDSPEDIRRAIRYVKKNPEKENLPPQNWWFVDRYDTSPRPAGRG